MTNPPDAWLAIKAVPIVPPELPELPLPWLPSMIHAGMGPADEGDASGKIGAVMIEGLPAALAIGAGL